MADDPDQAEQPSVLHRPIPNRALELFVIASFIAVAIFILITPVSCNRNPHIVRDMRDMSNIRFAAHGIIAYTVDHDGQLPAHIDLLEAYGMEDEQFISRHDDEEALVYEKEPEPGCQ